MFNQTQHSHSSPHLSILRNTLYHFLVHSRWETIPALLQIVCEEYLTRNRCVNVYNANIFKHTKKTMLQYKKNTFIQTVPLLSPFIVADQRQDVMGMVVRLPLARWRWPAGAELSLMFSSVPNLDKMKMYPPLTFNFTSLLPTSSISGWNVKITLRRNDLERIINF